MEKNVYETLFLKLLYESEKEQMIHVIFPATKKLTEEEYKKMMTGVTLKMEEFRIKTMILDLRDFQYLVSPDVQNWIVENINPRWGKIGIKKVAMIMPSEFIANLSIEQLDEELKDAQSLYQLSMFGDIESAQKWINS